MAVARSSFDGVAICYLLPLLGMTSCLHIVARNVATWKKDIFKSAEHAAALWVPSDLERGTSTVVSLNNKTICALMSTFQKFRNVVALAAFSAESGNLSVWRPSVCLSRRMTMIWYDLPKGATMRPAYVSALLSDGRHVYTVSNTVCIYYKQDCPQGKRRYRAFITHRSLSRFFVPKWSRLQCCTS